MTQRTDLPTGTVTFLFSDIEGSTRLLQSLGDRAHELFDLHAAVIRRAVAEFCGVVVNTDGDAFFCVFEDAALAVAAASAIQQRLARDVSTDDAAVRVRIGVHTGTAVLGGSDYQGLDVHRAARIADAGHGGQVVASQATVEALDHRAPDGVSLRDLGVHRLKDLIEPERLHDLVIVGLDSDFPPLRTIATDAGALPEQLDEFVGRTAEIHELVQAVRTHRLVTCTGPGGVGKSRLAVAVAHALASSFPRTAFVALAPLETPDAVAPAILRSLGVAPSSEPARVRLPAVLASEATLLVLDNFEHILDAAPLIVDLLAAVPALRILATSRAPLRIGGEQEYPVPPLATGRSSDAEELFLSRARAVRPDLSLGDDDERAVDEIIEILGGIPLAVELAAARTALMSPVALRARMSSVLDLAAAGTTGLEPRQRTLRSTIRWSYDLLTDEQRSILDAISVFRGGATLDSIEAVTRDDRSYWDWLADLEALVAHSLLARAGAAGDARFLMLEMIREFGQEHLTASGRAAEVADRHVAWFLALAERASDGIRTRSQRLWLDALEDDRANLQIALATAMETGDTQRAARLVHALWRFWHMRGPVPEGEQQVDKVLAMEQLDPAGRLLALEAAGGLAWWAGAMDRAHLHYQDALAVARERGTPEQLANALYNASLAAEFRETGAGMPLVAEAMDVAERAGDTQGIAQCRWAISAALQFDHDFVGAHEHLCAALIGFEEVGDAFMQHWTTRELGTVEMELGRMEDSRAHLRQSLDFFADAGDRSGIILLLRDHARISALGGDVDRALRLLGAAAAAEEESGLQLGAFELEALGLDNPIVVTDRAAADALMAEGSQWSLEEAVDYARTG